MPTKSTAEELAEKCAIAIMNGNEIDWCDSYLAAKEEIKQLILSELNLVELVEDGKKLEGIKPFIKQWTLNIQKHRGLKPEQLDSIFQEMYHWYCKLDVENRLAISEAMKEK